MRWLGGVLARSRASSAAAAVIAPVAAPALRAACLRRRRDERQRLQRRVVGVLQRAVAVAGEQDALDDGLGRRAHVAGTGIVQARRQHRPARRCPGERRCGVAQIGGRQRPVADADGDAHRRALGRHHECLADLALEPEPDEGGAIGPERAGHRPLLAHRHADGRISRRGSARHRRQVADRCARVPGRTRCGRTPARRAQRCGLDRSSTSSSHHCVPRPRRPTLTAPSLALGRSHAHDGSQPITAFPGHAGRRVTAPSLALGRSHAHDGSPGPITAFPGHAGRCWPLPRWRSVARTLTTAAQPDHCVPRPRRPSVAAPSLALGRSHAHDGSPARHCVPRPRRPTAGRSLAGARSLARSRRQPGRSCVPRPRRPTLAAPSLALGRSHAHDGSPDANPTDLGEAQR